jgi:flagellar biosynthesis protein FlhF
MRIKSYFARSVEEAVGQARQEMGPEAMLVNSRRASPEARHRGEYEVVFALTDPRGAETAEAAAAPPPDRLAHEVAELRKQLEGMRRTLTRSAMAPASGCPEGAAAFANLTANDVSPDLARELVQAAEIRASKWRPGTASMPAVDAVEFQSALTEELRSRVTVQPNLGRGKQPAITALVGPPGAGKTTTLVKLAVNYGLTSRRPVGLLTTDTYRVAAAEQLRAYASILGVAFQVADTLGALAQSLEEQNGKDLILIDTPGLGPADLDHGADLARFLSTRSDIDTQLVLSASMKSADLTRVIDAYEIFRPQRLIFTRLDETGSAGPIFNEAVRTGKPLSFFSHGQRIPEDLTAASREWLVGQLRSGWPGGVQSAA